MNTKVNVEFNLFLFTIGDIKIIAKKSNFDDVTEKLYDSWKYESNISGKILFTDEEYIENKFEIIKLNTDLSEEESEHLFNIILEEYAYYNDSHKSLYSIISDLTKWFQYGNIINKNQLLGYFGELFFIYLLNEKGINISKYFHNKENDLFDFYVTDISKYLEIKATLTKGNIFRIHDKQLTYNKNNTFLITFNFVEDLISGISIIELIDKITTENDNVLKLINKIKMLSLSSNLINNFKINIENYKINIYSAQNINTYVNVDEDKIKYIEYDIDLTNIESINIDNFIKILK
ncbi:hypothetical protein [Spiroplasma sp. DGKH1]|uniref:hypothetical protein n=1 Tax=Spiroplasma sp. DGKH1 TaxID=3050074 RepID=UPI0034C5C394